MLFAPKVAPVEEQSPVEEQQLSPEQPKEVEAEAEDELSLDNQPEENQVDSESPSQLTFPGRLSAVLPRHADPALRNNPLPAKDAEMVQIEPTPAEPAEIPQEPVVEGGNEELIGDPMDIDDTEADENAPSATVTTPPQSPPQQAINPAFGLRAKDLNDDVSDSEDELACSAKTYNKLQDDTTLSFAGVPATPTPGAFKTPRAGLPSSAIKAANRAIRSVSKGSRFGFTPLANQLSEWKASSPSKLANVVQASSPEFKDEGFSLLKEHDTAPAESTPSRGFFDEEMRIRMEMENQAAMEAALEADINAKYEEPEFDDIPITSEDVELAAEANEMSLMETAEIEMRESYAHEDAISEASQEYGDENAVPIDPALLGPVTPIRPSAPRAFHTVSKVPFEASRRFYAWDPEEAQRKCVEASS